jgi:DNA-directed RNA polymerase subunit K/omega
MIYPTIKDLTKGKYNRYELSIATAKGARLITDEYVRQRAAAESAVGGNKENDKPVAAMIDKKLKDEKAVKLSIDRLDSGEFVIVEEAELAVAEAEEAVETEKAEEEVKAEEAAADEASDEE